MFTLIALCGYSDVRLQIISNMHLRRLGPFTPVSYVELAYGSMSECSRTKRSLLDAARSSGFKLSGSSRILANIDDVQDLLL